MKTRNFLKLILVVTLSTICCKKEANVENKKPKKVSSIDTLDVVTFRRSYVDHHLLSEKEYERLLKSSPVLENYAENIYREKLFNELYKLEILGREESTFMLNLKYFESFNPKEVKFLDVKRQILFDYDLDLTKSNTIILKVTKNGILIEKSIEFERENFIGMGIEDVDNDGIKEILILLNYYIMNGDNYILMISKFVE